jgi:hypothetical protein
MVQHEWLMLAAAPPVVMGRALPTFLSFDAAVTNGAVPARQHVSLLVIALI